MIKYFISWNQVKYSIDRLTWSIRRVGDWATYFLSVFLQIDSDRSWCWCLSCCLVPGASGYCVRTHLSQTGWIGASDSGSAPCRDRSVPWLARDWLSAGDAQYPCASLSSWWLHIAMGQAAGNQGYSSHAIQNVFWGCSRVNHSWLRGREGGETPDVSGC